MLAVNFRRLALAQGLLVPDLLVGAIQTPGAHAPNDVAPADGAEKDAPARRIDPLPTPKARKPEA